jgi:NADPH:quinone reductase-like Zn-dependent oxidoreductase
MGFSLTANVPGRDNQAAMAELLGLIMDKKVRLIVDQVLPLSEAAKAYGRAEGLRRVLALARPAK